MSSDVVDQAWNMIVPNQRDGRGFLSNGKLLTHYTNAAIAVLGSGELRMRNARNMRDQEEIKLGRECVDEFLRSNATALFNALNSIHLDLYDRLLSLWLLEKEAQIDQSYIACLISQSADDEHGSQFHWDNYGSVALCLDPAFLRSEPFLLGLYLVEVNYGKETVLAGLADLLTALESQGELFRQLDHTILLSFLRHRLFFDSIASKAESFSREREWRLIHTPFLFASAHLQPQLVRRNGEDQEIYPLKFVTHIGTNIADLEVKNLIRKVLIHPKLGSQANQLRLDVISQLMNHHVLNASDRVHFVAKALPDVSQ